jgi:pimeloyl-ACP methyl ester carboxylesterase
MDQLGIAKTDLIGYSMGGFISSSLMIDHADRFNSVILAGVGDALLTRTGPAMSERSASIARAMESPDGGKSETEVARGFRIFAERSGNDLQALAAMQKAPRRAGFDSSKLSETKLPVMVLVGEADTLVGAGDKLAAAIPGARLVTVPGDHLSAVGAPELKAEMIDFLAEHSPVR